MKALIVLNLEDCTFNEIDEAKIKEVSLIFQDKETGKKYDFLWETGFKIIPMPEKVETPKIIQEQIDGWHKLAGEYIGWNRCIDEILGEIK